MKKLSILSALLGLAFVGVASAANITIYHSPHCPHCHHAREFIASTLIYEYPELTVTEVNVTDPANREKFQEALKKCEFESGGVPVLVIGDKCEQGYADFMQDTLRQHIEVDLTDEQKATAAENKKALAADAEKFKAEHSDRTSAITEYKTAASAAEAPAADTPAVEAVKKNSEANAFGFWILLIVLVAGLGYILVRGDKKKK